MQFARKSQQNLIDSSQGRAPPGSPRKPQITADQRNVILKPPQITGIQGELNCSALPVALPFYLTELRKVGASTENPVTVQVVVVSKCFLVTH